jgi:hypothetical protein
MPLARVIGARHTKRAIALRCILIDKLGSGIAFEGRWSTEIDDHLRCPLGHFDAVAVVLDFCLGALGDGIEGAKRLRHVAFETLASRYRGEDSGVDGIRCFAARSQRGSEKEFVTVYT